MEIVKATDYGFLRVIQVVENPKEPKWVHADGYAHKGTAPRTGDVAKAIADFKKEFGHDPEPGEWCHDCILNWRFPAFDKYAAPINPPGDFTFYREELWVGLNGWSNPVHDGQDAVAMRPKTWDELYAEIDARMGEHVAYGEAPREAAPKAVPEGEPDFELAATNRQE